MTWRCPNCETRMQVTTPSHSGNWVGPFIHREQHCLECGHELATREYAAAHLRAVERRVIELEKAVARYQDELWEAGKL